MLKGSLKTTNWGGTYSGDNNNLVHLVKFILAKLRNLRGMNRQIGLKAKCTVLFSIFETDPIRMRQLLDNLFKNQSLIYKYFLYVVSVICIVFFFPRGGKFKYEFQKGKPCNTKTYMPLLIFP